MISANSEFVNSVA